MDLETYDYLKLIKFWAAKGYYGEILDDEICSPKEEIESYCKFWNIKL